MGETKGMVFGLKVNEDRTSEYPYNQSQLYISQGMTRINNHESVVRVPQPSGPVVYSLQVHGVIDKANGGKDSMRVYEIDKGRERRRREKKKYMSVIMTTVMSEQQNQL